MRRHHLFFLFVIVLSLFNTALAGDEIKDPFNKFIKDMFQMHSGKTLCKEGALTIGMVRKNILKYVKEKGMYGDVPNQELAKIMWTLYPCPFSPYRAELRPAKYNDVTGAWLFPESSQKFRYGPRSTQESPTGSLPISCDAVGYYPNGELRHVIVAVQKCPYKKASDLEPSRKNPLVSNWSMIRDGRIRVTRSDVKNHVEEWGVYSVISSFTVQDVKFKPGDLVAYVRREGGNDVEAATQFRHLQRLD